MVGTPLKQLLSKVSKQKDLLQAFREVHVILGNESCDLDSAVSALCLSLLVSSEVSSEDVAVIPVLNIPREDFPLRTEVSYLFREKDVPHDRLVFRDEVDLSALQRNRQLRLTLVDHHVLPAPDQGLGDSVVEVVDHRPLDPAQKFPANARVDVRIVGSCASLVAERIVDRAQRLLDAQVAALLMGTVLLDTACFSPEADRTTPLDVAAVESCERVLFSSESAPEDREEARRAVFQELVNARSDVSALTTSQLLRKDLKVVRGVPLPGMPLLTRAFLERPDATVALADFCTRMDAPAAVVMGMCFASGNLQRDLFVYRAGPEQPANKLTQALRDAASLDLVEVPSSVPGVTLFKQNNLKASRKQVLPIVRTALDDL